MSKAAQARADAERFKRIAWFWRLFTVIFCPLYFLVSSEPYVERIMLVVIAALSIWALVDTNESRAEGALARAAGYES